MLPTWFYDIFCTILEFIWLMQYIFAHFPTLHILIVNYISFL